VSTPLKLAAADTTKPMLLINGAALAAPLNVLEMLILLLG
jgi:hypothetical protein